MNRTVYSITAENLQNLFNTLSARYRLILPYGKEDSAWQPFSGSFQFQPYRAVTSIRQFFTPAKELIDTYFSETPHNLKPYCIVGAKSCDLESLKIHDYVFLEGEADSTYKAFRERNLIISGDCTSFKKVCFCLALDITPYPQELFDLNLSQIRTGYLAEIGSDKGQSLIDENKKLFERAEDKHIYEKEENRKDIVEKLLCQLKPQALVQKSSLYTLIKHGYEHQVWQAQARTCVECGACIMNCPTCHCFLLFDINNKEDYLRSRTWDGCQYKNFTRVAGGANPLKLREQRLRNRYIKKFQFFFEKVNIYACTGCGRCIECCPGKIDLREIFRKLSHESAGV